MGRNTLGDKNRNGQSSPFKREKHIGRYYIACLKAGRFNKLISGYSDIFNKQLHVLDVNFNEDASRVRNEHVDQNLSVIRGITLNMVKLNTDKRKSQSGQT